MQLREIIIVGRFVPPPHLPRVLVECGTVEIFNLDGINKLNVFGSDE